MITCPQSLYIWGQLFLPEGKRSMTGWLSTCSVALPPLLVNRTTWYLPSLTITALSSMIMSSVPTLKITPTFPRSCTQRRTLWAECSYSQKKQNIFYHWISSLGIFWPYFLIIIVLCLTCGILSYWLYSTLLNNWSNCPKDYRYFARVNIYGLQRSLPVLHQSSLVEGRDAEIAQKSGSMDKCHEGLVHSAGITTSVHCNCPTHRTSCTCLGNVLVVPLLKPSVSRLSEVWNAYSNLPNWFTLLSTIVGGYHK